MADVTYKGQSGNHAYSTTVAIPKYASLAVGQLMLAYVGTLKSVNISAPSGWTYFQQSTYNGQYKVYMFWKIADADDVAASTFTFTSVNNEGNLLQGVIYVFENHDPSSPVQAGAGDDNYGSTMSCFSTTPPVANCMMLMLGCIYPPAISRTSDWYITNDNPSWNVGRTYAYTNFTFALARALRPEITPTGTCYGSWNNEGYWALMTCYVKPIQAIPLTLTESVTLTETYSQVSTLSRMCCEAVTLVSTARHSATITLEDIISLIPSVVKSFSLITTNEGLTLVESGIAKEEECLKTESLGFEDSITKNGERELTDDCTLSVSVYKETKSVMEEVLSLAEDAVTFTISPLIEDVISLITIFDRSTDIKRPLPRDEITLEENFISGLVITRVLSQTITLVVTSVPLWVKLLEEAITLVESTLPGTFSISKMNIEEVDIAESFHLAFDIAFYENISQSIKLLDEITRFEIETTFLDTLVTVDTFERTTDIIRTLPRDVVTLVGKVSFDLSLIFSDTFSILESSARVISRMMDLHTYTITDPVVRMFNRSRTLEDNCNVSEDTLSVMPTKTASEIILITDSVYPFYAMGRIFSESFSLVTETVTFNLSILKEDVIVVSSNLIASTSKAFTETITAIDVLWRDATQLLLDIINLNVTVTQLMDIKLRLTETVLVIANVPIFSGLALHEIVNVTDSVVEDYVKHRFLIEAVTVTDSITSKIWMGGWRTVKFVREQFTAIFLDE